MFQGLRQGALIYILDKRKPELTTAQVMSVSNPMPRYNATPMAGIEQVVDISAMTTTGQVDYKQLQALATLANFGTENVVVSDSREAMTAEVESMTRASQAVLASVAFHQNIIAKKDEMLMVLNPDAAKAKQQEQEIATLNAKIASMENMLSRMESLLSVQETKHQEP